MRFLKKATPVDAVQWNGNNLSEVQAIAPVFKMGEGCCLEAYGSPLCFASIGHWIVKESADVFRIYNPEAFALTYEPAV
jgi:hypothetical protein